MKTFKTISFRKTVCAAFGVVCDDAALQALEDANDRELGDADVRVPEAHPKPAPMEGETEEA